VRQSYNDEIRALQIECRVLRDVLAFLLAERKDDATKLLAEGLTCTPVKKPDPAPVPRRGTKVARLFDPDTAPLAKVIEIVPEVPNLEAVRNELATALAEIKAFRAEQARIVREVEAVEAMTADGEPH
jgi:hypothetical protein